MGAMGLDASEICLKCSDSAAPKIFDDPRDFIKRQRARLGDIGEGAADKGLALGADRRRRDRRAAIRLQRGVRNAPDMPDLDEDAAAMLMHAVRYFSPARHLLFGIDSARALITLALLRNLARLGDQEPCGCALPVIFDCQWAGYHARRNGAVAGERRHDKPIGPCDPAHLEWLAPF